MESPTTETKLINNGMENLQVPHSTEADEDYRRIFSTTMHDRGLKLQQKTMENIKRSKEHRKKIEETAPADELAKEWFSQDKLTVGTRAYLLDRIMPSVVQGVEDMLKEAEKKKVLDGDSVKFDPIHCLAEYLMRHNPEFSNDSEKSAYARGLEQVTADLKNNVFDLEFNRLGQLKEELKGNQDNRVQVESIQRQIIQKRKEALSLQFQEWTVDVTGRTPLALVQSALKSFFELVYENTAGPRPEIKELETVDTLEQKLSEEEFIEYVYPFITHINTDDFQEFLHHMAQCADMFRETIRHDIWRQMFSELFLACDAGKVGFLDRQRVLTLLEIFYDRITTEGDEWQPRNPRQWPIIEIGEMDPADFWVDFQEGVNPTEEKGEEHTTETSLITAECVPAEEDLRKSADDAGEGPVVEIGEMDPGDFRVDFQEGVNPTEEKGEEHTTETSLITAECVPAEEDQKKSAENAGEGPIVEIGEMDPADFQVDLQERVNPTEEKVEEHTTETSLIIVECVPAEDAGEGPIVEIGEMDPADFRVDLQEGVNPTKEKGEEQATATSLITVECVPAEEDPKKSAEDAGEGSTATTENEQTSQVEDSGSKGSHFIEGKPWSGDLLTSDLAIRYSSYGDRNQDECYDTVSKFTDLCNIISDINTRGPSRIPSAFNDSALNIPQFVQLMETFVGDAPLAAVEKLTSFIQKEYVETEEERIALLAKIREDALTAQQKIVLQALFEKWDNDGSGFLLLEEVEGVLAKYKEGMESEVMTKGRESVTSQSQQRSRKLSMSEFTKYILGVVHQLPAPKEEEFENIIEFLTSCIERTQAEKLRGATRRKWLQHIQIVAETSGVRLDAVYKAVFQALYKDAEAHGNHKKISANIALLEQSSPGERWNEVLRYVACTSEDASYVLNKTLHRDMKGVSFAAVDSGIPQHVPRVQYHGNIQFWNKDRPKDERKGSLIVLPLIDAQQRVFGTFSIDTLREPHDRNIFLTHEISFYQGVTNVYSSAYHHVQRKMDILQLVSSAFAWIYSRAPNIRAIHTYLMEPCADKAKGYVFRNMMHTDNNTGISEINTSPATLRRRDNLFRDYLFKCADSSEVITTDAYGERHIAVPIRDHTGRALGVLDLNTGDCRELPPHEYQDLQKMLQMLQEASNELLDDERYKYTTEKAVLEAEKVSGHRKVGVLFHRFMLQDLRQCVSKLDHKSFAELKSYKEPPVMVHSILKAVLLLFVPEWAESEEIHSWNQCKLKVNSDLIRKILSFDPTAQSVRVNPEILAKYIKGIPRGAVWKQGSIPAEHLFNWAFTCLSLMELTLKMQNTQSPSQV